MSTHCTVDVSFVVFFDLFASYVPPHHQLVEFGFARKDMRPHPNVSCWVKTNTPLPRPILIKHSPEALAITRDLLGFTPLFYRQISARAWACSDNPGVLRALLPAIDTLDPERVASIALNLIDLDFSSGSLWKGMNRVPAGATLHLGGLGDTITEVSDGARGVCAPTRFYSSSRLLHRLRHALASDARSPLALSSGTDSSLLAMILSRRRGSRGETIARAASMTFPTLPECDETAEVTHIADTLKMPCLFFDPRAHGTFSSGRDSFYTRQLALGPHAHPGELHELAFIEAAAEHYGSRRVVMGVGADQLMHNPTYWVVRQLLVTDRDPPDDLRAFWRRHLGVTHWARQRTQAIAKQSLVSEARLKRLLHARLPIWVSPRFQLPASILEGKRRLNAASFTPGRTYPVESLSSWAWEMQMRSLLRLARSTDVLVSQPYLDEQLWEAFMMMPPWLAVGPIPGHEILRDKLLLRHAHARMWLLSKVTAWRGKMATFSRFVEEAMLGDGYDKARALLEQMRLESMEIVDAKLLVDVLERAKHKHPHPNDPPITNLWFVLSTELWLRAVESTPPLG